MRIIGSSSSGGSKPTTPTIGAATDGGTGTTVSVAFTPSTYIGKGTITYTATSNPGSLTGTGSGSPITVSGLTTGTAYTFTVRGTTNYGVNSDSSAASNSVTPVTPSSFDSIATASGTGSSGVITFNSIPSTYKHLQIRITSKEANTTLGRKYDTAIYFNGDETSLYAYQYLTSDGAAVTSSPNANQTSIYIQNTTLESGSPVASIPAVSIIDIIDYQNTSKFKTVRAFSGYDTNRSTSPVGQVFLYNGLYRSTNAISSISIKVAGGDWSTSTSIALYGIKG